MNKKIELKYNIIKPLFAIGVAYLIAIGIILATSANPWTSVRIFVTGPLGSSRYLANVVEMMIPLMFTGLAILMMFKVSQYNLVVEGIFFLAGSLSAYIAINTNMPSVVSPIVIILICGVVGSLIAFIPAWLKVKFQANELVTSLMMNYILFNLGMYILNYHMFDIASGFNASFRIPVVSKLALLVPKTRIHYGLIIALVAVAAISYVVYRMKLGYEMGIVGENPNFAKYSGIKVAKTVIVAQLIGGFLAGVGGSVEILGLYPRFQWEILTNYGFDGIVIATLARTNPVLVPVAAFFLAYMRTGADIVARRSDVPVEFVGVIQAIVLVLVGATLLLENFKRREIVAASKKEIQSGDFRLNEEIKKEAI